ncbi:MAG: hypothetical protein AAF614_23535 [Chloroflexota bacterium]
MKTVIIISDLAVLVSLSVDRQSEYWGENGRYMSITAVLSESFDTCFGDAQGRESKGCLAVRRGHTVASKPVYSWA